MSASAPTTDHADVVVVGGGLAGLLVAGWLAEAGVDVVLCERDHAFGGAWGLGLVELGVTEYPSRTIASLGERAATLLAWTARSKEHLSELGLWERTGMLWVPVLPDEHVEVARSVQSLGRHGIAAEVREVAELARAQLTARHAALGLPGDGRLRTSALAQLTAWAADVGATLCTGVRVDEVQDDDGLRVITPGGGIRAEAVVLTAGVGGSALHPVLRGFSPVREQGLRIEGGAHLPPAGRAGQGWTAWRSDEDGVRICGARWATPHLEVGEREPVVTDVVQSKLEAFARGPLGLVGPVVQRWAWVFSQSPDGLPIVGPLPGDPRLVGCIGFGAAAPGLAVAAARSVVEGLLGTDEAPVPWLLSTRRTVRWRYGR